MAATVAISSLYVYFVIEKKKIDIMQNIGLPVRWIAAPRNGNANKGNLRLHNLIESNYI